MSKSIPFGTRSTADKVLAGVDLTGRRIVVTGCNSGLGFETMNSLVANGAHVFGLARSLESATQACDRAGPSATPVACDLADLESIAAAADTIRRLQVPLDAIVANAGIANLPTLETRYGVEMQFFVNHVSHFYLVNELSELVRNGTGRIVIVSSNASKTSAPAQGIAFDNLDGRRFYHPSTFYGQSKLANALYAKELSRRLVGRGIAVNSLHPGATRGTALNRSLRLPLRMIAAVAQPFMRSARRGAATQALLAASPQVAGISGEYWSDCRIVKGNPLLQDLGLAKHLWKVSEEIITRHGSSDPKVLREAA